MTNPTKTTSREHLPAAGPLRPAREQQAMDEVGHTHVATLTAWLLIGAFLAAILPVASIQAVHDYRTYRRGERSSAWPEAAKILDAPAEAWQAATGTEGPFLRRVLAGNAALRKRMADYEDALETNSRVMKLVRVPLQRALLAGGAGGENTCVGRDGWLFYRPGIDHLIGPGFMESQAAPRPTGRPGETVENRNADPLAAVLDLHRQLAQRNIRLVVLPVPDKASIHPEQFSTRYTSDSPPPRNPSYDEFCHRLAAAGVVVCDPTPELTAIKRRTVQGAFLRDDTHWRPEAMEAIAQRLADCLHKELDLPAVASAPLTRTELVVAAKGDLAGMLDLPDCDRRRQAVTVWPVVTQRGELWRADPAADVLLLGDSFTNIYSLEAMGWGGWAGLNEQLSFTLQRPVDVLARNDNGAFASRRMLADELARGRDRLAGKRVVVWQFAARELSVGDWRLVDMTLNRAPADLGFLDLPPCQSVEISATVAAVAAVPRPGSVPYRDHVMAVHLVDLTPVAGQLEGDQAVAYVRSMRGGDLTAAAAWRPGQRVIVRLRPWADVESQVGRFNRSELDSLDLQLQPPLWGEVVAP